MADIATQFATFGIEYIGGITENRRRIRDPLIASGFLNSQNYTFAPPNNGKLYGAHRANPVTAMYRSASKATQFNYEGGVNYTGITTAYVDTENISSVGSFTGGTETEANAKLDAIPMSMFTGVNGMVRGLSNDIYLGSKAAEHAKAICEKAAGYILRGITRPHNIKNDFDGHGPMGDQVTFEEDVGTARALKVQVVDLSTTNTDPQSLQARLLMKELTAAAGDIYSSISQVPFVIIPTSAFNTYKSVLTWGTQKDTYVGAERVTQSDTGVTYALPFFHADGFNFVSVPDKYFEVRKIPASTGPDCWVALIAPASALQVFLNPVKPSNWLNYGDMSVFGNQDVLNTMLKSEFLEPDLYNMLAANDREDQFLRTYMNRYGGAGNLDWQVMNAISTYIRPLPPGGDPNAMAVTIQSRLDIAVLRMQPQYIQQWAIPKVLV